MTRRKILIGEFEAYGLRDGFFYLDGGSMFGVVPKTIWEKKAPPDEKNRIKMGLNSLLIKSKDALILVETGAGENLEKKFIDFYSIEREPDLLSSLKAEGFKPEEIDFVVNTHLHFDHCGGNTRKDEEGEFIPTYKNAKYIIQKEEWNYALHPSERDKPSYFPERFLPLEKFNQVHLAEGDEEIVPGVEVVLTPGHTASHQCLKVSSKGKTLFFLGDMVPTSAHVGLSYIMSYDLFPLQTLENKKKFFELAIEEDWILSFVHDPHHFFGKVIKEKDKYLFRAI